MNKTSLLVLSLLVASTNAIEIMAVPATKPVEHSPEHIKVAAPDAAHHDAAAAKPVAHKESAPKVVDHKVDSPAHHVAVKAHKATAAKAPSPADHVADHKSVKSDDDKVLAHHVAAKVDHKSHTKSDSHVEKDTSKSHAKCDTPSCKAAAGEAVPVVATDDKPKMVVVHKADDTKKPEVHTIKTRPAPAAHHADPATKAH